MFEQIPVKEIISHVKTKLRLQDTTEHDDEFELLAYRCIRLIDSLSIFAKHNCEIDVCDSKAVLPKGFQRLLGLRLLCDEATALDTTGTTLFYDNFIYVDSKFLMDCSCDLDDPLYRNSSSFFSMNNGYLYFNSNLDITGVRVAYMGLNLNDEGLPMIYDYYEECIECFICWNFTLSFSELYKDSVIRSYETRYYSQRAWVRATDQKNNFTMNKRKIGELATALLVSRFENELGSTGI